MSHIQTLKSAKERCETTRECDQYEALLEHEYQKIDTYTDQATQKALTVSAVVGIIGLLILLTPFVNAVHRGQQFILPKLVIALPILLGLAIGALIGFGVTFGNCFKSSCSFWAQTAMFTIPLSTLVLTIPLGRRLYGKRQAMANAIARSSALIWVSIGGVITAVALLGMVVSLVDSPWRTELFEPGTAEVLRKVE